MASWHEIEAEVPELAGRAKALFDAGLHKTLATLRRDGAPRISGTECLFVDGNLWFGSMWRAAKALDLLRDPRFALHSASIVEPEWAGDAKVAGRAEDATDPAAIARVLTRPPPGRMHLFRAEIDELVVVSVNDDQTKMIVESWHPGRGITRVER
jgi:hypothetical protein